jgi:hypothetical protein
LAAPASGHDASVAADPSVYRRRRLTALGVLAVAVLLIGFAIGAASGGSGTEERGSGGADGGGDDAPARELPRGGRRIFPDFRVVGFYGAPQDPELGILGIGTPKQAARKLVRQARPYGRPSRPVLPMLELIAVVAASDPGDDGAYRMHQPDRVIRRYLAAAREAKALLVLDIQPGRSGFVKEVRRLEKWLREPDVGIALDPEWYIREGGLPGQVIGSVHADEVNAVSELVANIVAEHRLPEKLFVVHQFTEDMIRAKETVKRRPGLAITFNVDGFGDRPNKIAKYRSFTSEAVRFHDGFKLFYKEDTNLFTPAAVLRLRPPPDLVVYE